MNDEEVIAALRKARGACSPVELAAMIGDLSKSGLSHGSFVTYLGRAFPEIPLRVLLDLGMWHRLTDGPLSDAEVNAALEPWLGPGRVPRS